MKKLKRTSRVKIVRPIFTSNINSGNLNHSYGTVMKVGKDGTAKVKSDINPNGSWESIKWLIPII